LNKDVAGLERLVRAHRDIRHFAGDVGHDRHRIADHHRGTLRRAPAHRNKQAEHQEQKDKERGDLSEQVERNDLELHEEEEKHQVNVEEGDDHRGASTLRAAGMST
jgi:hypothetical protein